MIPVNCQTHTDGPELNAHICSLRIKGWGKTLKWFKYRHLYVILRTIGESHESSHISTQNQKNQWEFEGNVINYDNNVTILTKNDSKIKQRFIRFTCSGEFRKIHPTAFSNVQGFCTWENQSNTVWKIQFQSINLRSSQNLTCISFKSALKCCEYCRWVWSLHTAERERDTHILDPWCSGPILHVYWVRSW